MAHNSLRTTMRHLLGLALGMAMLTSATAAIALADSTTADALSDARGSDVAEAGRVVEAVGGSSVGDVVSLVPARLLETRSGSGFSTVDGEFVGAGRVGAGGVVEFGVLGRGGVPVDGVSAVVLNVTAVGPLGAGHVTVFPCGVVPNASS
ncbi:MAG: hypothetical protein RIB65_15745, partial [Ilumatobacter fluminis]